VEITAEVLNINTGAILADFKGAAESSRTGDITVISGRGHVKTSTEILGSEFVESLLPEATSAAVEQIAAQLNGFAEKFPVLRITIEGRVAEVTGNVLTLNVGKKSGLRIGQQMEVLREATSAAPSASEAGQDPQRLAGWIGLATITELGDDYAMATFSGSASAQVGDFVRLNLSSDSH